MTRVTEEFFILFFNLNLNLYSQMWLVATVLSRAELEEQ